MTPQLIFIFFFRKWSLQVAINTEIEIKHLCINENKLHHPLTGNIKSKDLLLFITFSTMSYQIQCHSFHICFCSSGVTDCRL